LNFSDFIAPIASQMFNAGHTCTAYWWPIQTTRKRTSIT